MDRTVLQNFEQNISGIFQLREHHEIELFEIILLVGLLRKEAHRLLAGQNDSRRLRAGKGQGKSGPKRCGRCGIPRMGTSEKRTGCSSMQI